MLLLSTAAPVAARPAYSVHDLFSPDKLFSTTQDLLAKAPGKIIQILVICLIAWIATRVLTFFTDRMVRIAERHAAAATRLSQARTLSSVLRATGIGIVGFLAGLQVLSILGFNLGPLLTSAGIAGVAIGLACQTVVKDCLNGMLILVEDQYNVGDTITVAGLSGQVEAMSLRKTMIRDGDGTLYIVPNSQITTVANKTRDFSVATINVEVDYSANPDEVIKLLTETALSVRNDPAYKDAFLADPTLLGVDAIKGSQVTYPVQLKTLANQQWAAKRELQRRIRLALEEHGMLPGDPLRVFKSGALAAPGSPAEKPAENAAVDPTTLKAAEINPFTGEGL